MLLVDRKLIQALPDLFDLTAESLMPLEHFAETSVHKLVDAIRRASRAELPRFIYALGIPGVGVKVARDLAGHFGSIHVLMQADAGRLKQVPGTEPRLAENITGFFADPGNQRVIHALLAGRLTIVPSRNRRAYPA